MHGCVLCLAGHLFHIDPLLQFCYECTSNTCISNVSIFPYLGLDVSVIQPGLFTAFHRVLKLVGTSQQCNPACRAGRSVPRLLALYFSIHSPPTARVSRDTLSIAQYQDLVPMNHGKQNPQLISLGGKNT